MNFLVFHECWTLSEGKWKTYLHGFLATRKNFPVTFYFFLLLSDMLNYINQTECGVLVLKIDLLALHVNNKESKLLLLRLKPGAISFMELAVLIH